MTRVEFNEKWKANLKYPECPGLQIDEEVVINYLDEQFTEEVAAHPNFHYSQIKIKVGTCRIYANAENKTDWEYRVNEMLGVPREKYIFPY